MFFSVITTIQEPTHSVKKLAERIVSTKGGLVIVGDSKGPASFNLSDVDGLQPTQLAFLNLEDQLKSEFQLAKDLPTKHYSRKNIGYLYAIAHGASSIYETDDDNAPLPSWKVRDEYDDCQIIRANKKVDDSNRPDWVNVYQHFSKENIWPRGLPLDQIRTPVVTTEEASNSWAPIQQGLANGAPDVDAVWRLVMDREFSFADNSSVMVEPGQWCPFNTQSTWWWPVVYPLLYIPSYCSFRMCDIWKSFVAQRCLWALGTGVLFHAPEVYQERNPHNLMRDFSDEVVGYEQNDRIAKILQSTSLETGEKAIEDNLFKCYESLVKEKIFPAEELVLLEGWLSALKQIRDAVKA